jgi:steroid delta-isomerase-like uncharacterized protein
MSRVTRSLIAATALAAGLALTALPAAAAPAPDAPAVVHGAAQGQNQGVPLIVQQWANAWNTANGAALAQLFTTDATYTDHAFQSSVTGQQAIAQLVAQTTQMMGPPKVTITSAFCSGDNAAVTYLFSGTFTDKAPFTPPYSAAGKSFSVPVETVFTLRQGLLSSDNDYYNLADILRQVGLPAGPYTPYTPPSAG